MGNLHARICNDVAGCKLVAVVDTNFERAGSLALKYHCQAYRDFTKISEMTDAVIISSPTNTHYSIAKEFLARKIPVLVEKPLAHNLNHGKELVKIVADEKEAQTLALGDKVLVASKAFNPIIRKL